MSQMNEQVSGVPPPRMGSQNVPDLINIGAIKSNMAIDVSSDVLDPIVNNQNNCRFSLTNKGYLHDGSRITFSVKGNASVLGGAYFPPNVGVHSLIKRATLRVGGQTISEMDDYNHFMGYKSMFLSNEINKDREAVMSGRSVAHDFHYVDTAGAQSNTSATNYNLDTGVEYNGNNVTPNTYLDVNNQPVFSITLGQLFPFLKGVNLPLFAMRQEVLIDLVWEPVSTTGRCSVASGASSATEFEIDTTEVKMVADYLFYDGEIMAQQLTAYNSRPTKFLYNDYRLTKTSLSVTAAQNSVRNLGGAGRIVTKVITGINDDNRTDRYILNKYSAVAPARDYLNASVDLRKNGTLTTNIRMNDFFVFPIDLRNTAVLFDKTVRAEGSFPFVTREEYSAEGNIISGRTFLGVAQNASVGLVGNYFFQAYKLPAGRVNTRGLELTTQLASLPALGAGLTYTQRTYIEISREAVLSDGFLTAGFL